MILSVSRRTDIPAFYSEWFFNRLRDGYVLVRNPYNIKKISKIIISPDITDCVVFWSKNPAPMVNKLDLLKDYKCYFQFTLNSYGADIEPYVPSKNNKIIYTFKTLSSKVGAEKIIWRYDPILLNDKYTADYHKKYFYKLAYTLKGYFNSCTISFANVYNNNKPAFDSDYIRSPSVEQIKELAESFSKTADAFGFKINACSEIIDLGKYGIGRARCIDRDLIEKICGYKINFSKDKNQRKECGCIESVDIGTYNTCPHCCKYCYAIKSAEGAKRNYQKSNAVSPLLCGSIGENDVISERKIILSDKNQLSRF